MGEFSPIRLPKLCFKRVCYLYISRGTWEEAEFPSSCSDGGWCIDGLLGKRFKFEACTASI